MAKFSRRDGFLLVGLLACGRSPSDTEHSRIGIVARFLDGQVCMAVSDSSLAIGQRFTIASIPVIGDTTPHGLGEVEVTGLHPGTCVALWGELGGTDYIMKDVHQPVPAYGQGPSIALVGGRAVLAYRDRKLQTDLNGDGKLETFRACTSDEGIHLTLWTGIPLQGQRVWHSYFLLGYDVEPSCLPADYDRE